MTNKEWLDTISDKTLRKRFAELKMICFCSKVPKNICKSKDCDDCIDEWFAQEYIQYNEE